MKNSESLTRVLQYHEATKHHTHRLARGPGYMDWANMPDPFRRFSGAPLIPLPVSVRDDSPPYVQIFQPEAVSPQPVGGPSLSRFLELSLAISAWKQAGDSRWALRSNPSSGNLHPTEGYLVLGPTEGIGPQPGVYHYAPKDHALERRSEFSAPVWRELMQAFPPDSFLAGLTSIHWREAWKYGERAFRYCQHDIGHALAATRVAAAALGWNLVVLEDVDDERLSRLLGLDRESDFADAEQEHPDLLAVVFPGGERGSIPLGLKNDAVDAVARAEWQGRANRLSAEGIPWKIIDTVADAAWKGSPEKNRLSGSPGKARGLPVSPEWTVRRERVTARQIIRQRRSAVAFDGVTSLSEQEFYACLGHTVVGAERQGIPWDAIAWSPKIHLALFVHRVRGLTPGLYFLVRDPARRQALKRLTRPEFLWRKPQGCPEALDLYLLKEGDFQSLAAQVSCTQDIAGQSAFSLGMIAEFQPVLEREGPWFYRRLFWESGLVGHMLYLAAEFLGVRSTGIGCYFDDPVHEILGFPDRTYQSLYHFTVGGAVEDTRLTTLPAYPWSCEIPTGRFPSRFEGSLERETQKRTRPLSPEARVTWQGRTLCRIAAGLGRFAPAQGDHRRALSEILKSPMNVLETCPDLSGGRDELLLGDALNAALSENPALAQELFLIARTGPLKGEAVRGIEAMKRRGTPWTGLVDLPGGAWWSLDPGFLKDQLERSMHRLGLGALDLYLVRLPREAMSRLGKTEFLARLRRTAQYLQAECDAGRLLGFGVSFCESRPGGPDEGSLLFPDVWPRLQEFPGFSAVEFHANFLEAGPFRGLGGNPSPVSQVKAAGRLVLCSGPLRAWHEGQELGLVDRPDLGPEALQAQRNQLARDLEHTEQEIHATLCRDGRSLKEILRQANAPSPFQLRALAQACLESPEVTPEGLRNLDESFHEVLTHARFLGEQLVNARLLDLEESRGLYDAAETVLSRVRHLVRATLKNAHSDLKVELRRTYFPASSPSVSLQILGIQWLFQEGADLVVNGMRHPSYVQEALRMLRTSG